MSSKLKDFNPLALSDTDLIIGTRLEDDDVAYPTIHIRIVQRKGSSKGGKHITTVEGIPSEFDHSRLLSAMKKEFNCNGALRREELHEHPDCMCERVSKGIQTVLQLTGDQREKIRDFLLHEEITIPRYITIHGY